MAGYTKLFGSILDSSIWREPDTTRLVWLTLMAMADRDGIVDASIDGIADRAKVRLEAAEGAMACFMAPDPKSKNPANKGRRVERTTEGYRLLNYDFYRQKMSAEEMRAKNAERQRRYRERHAVTSDVTSRPVTARPKSNHIAEAEEEAEAEADPPPDPDARARGTWTADQWRIRFAKRWCDKYQQLSMGGGDGAAKATGALHDALAELSAQDRKDAEMRSGGMFDEFLSDESPAVVKARHQWSWFVGRFSGLRVPAKAAKRPESREELHRREAREIEASRKSAEKTASDEARRILAELDAKEARR